MKREGLYLQGGLALNSWYAETEATRNGREQSSRGRRGPSSPRGVFDRTGVVKSSKQASRKSVSASSRSPMPDWHFRLAACATQREMHCHPRLVRFARCVLRKWRRYCPGAILNARWNTVRIELTFPNPHSPAIVSMLF